MKTKLITICLFLISSQVFAEECKGEYGSHWDNCHGTYTNSNEAKYVGEFKKGKRHGHGTLTFPDGEKYVGEFENNKLLLVDKELTIFEIVEKSDPVCHKSSNDFNVIKLCLEKYLIFDGQPLHPLIVQEFITWLSDGGDQIISINLKDAVGSNRYCCDDSFSAKLSEKKILAHTDFVRDYKTYDNNYISQEDCGRGYCTFTYAHLGTTDNGAIVIQVWYSGGGSSTFSTLLFTKVKERMGANFDYENPANLAFDKKQIVLEKLFSIALGDRQQPTISVNGNFVVLNGTKIKIPSH